jgi:Ca2+-binding RTX toxin-like protein
MNSLFRWLNVRSQPRRLSQRRPVTLQVEPLEARWVPASVGITKFANLDFAGDYISRAQALEGGWGDLPVRSFSSFHSLFSNTRPWLDMNGDSTVNSTDANLAIDRIMDKVKADYTPYRVKVIQQDQDVAQPYLTDSVVGDVTVMITGDRDRITGEDVLGVAPRLDVGNNQDEIVFVFAGGSVGNFAGNKDGWFNQIARTISHEMGHAFGLDHEVSDPFAATDPITHSVMGTSSRDWSRDFVFQDRYFVTAGGIWQNAHRTLLKEDVLGRSFSTYIAVLEPGVLTVSGNYRANEIQVREWSSTTWQVTLDGTSTYANRNSTSIFSLNPFDEPITRVKIVAEGGDDIIDLSLAFDEPAYIYAGDGNDTVKGGDGPDNIYGGAGNDLIQGNAGNDRIFGEDGHDILRGQDGDDYLYGGRGNDWLYGENGNDRLYGQDGRDILFGHRGDDILYGGNHNDVLDGGDGNDLLFGQNGMDGLFGRAGQDTLYGGNDDDFLDGGEDGQADALYGQGGIDTFSAEYYGILALMNRDHPRDLEAGESVVS